MIFLNCKTLIFLLLAYLPIALSAQANDGGSTKKPTQKTTMIVEIWSDMVCPFCYIGKRRFEQALAKFDNRDEVQIVWRSFQLDPDLISNPNISAAQSLSEKKAGRQNRLPMQFSMSPKWQQVSAYNTGLTGR